MRLGLGLGLTSSQRRSAGDPLALFPDDLEWFHKSFETDSLTLVSSKAAAIRDYSGHDRHFTQSNPAQRPAILTVGGLVGVDYDAPAAALNLGASGIAVAQPFYIAGVFRPVASPAAATTRHIFFLGGGGGRVGWREDTALFDVYAGSASASRAGALNAAHAVIGYFNGAASWIEVDGVRGLTASIGGNGVDSSFCCYGAGGGFGPNDNYVGQKFAGLCVSNTQPDAKLAALSNYLRAAANRVNV